MIKLECGDLSGMRSELQGFRDLSAFRHFEIGVFNVPRCQIILSYSKSKITILSKYLNFPYIFTW